MAMSAYQKEQARIALNEQNYKTYEAQGRLLKDARKNDYKPNPVVQADDVRSRLADRYHKVAQGQPVNTTAIQARERQGRPDSRLKALSPSLVGSQGAAPGMRGIVNSIGPAPASARPNTAASVIRPSRLSVNTGDEDRARKAIGGIARTASNTTTVFQQGLREKLKR